MVIMDNEILDNIIIIRTDIAEIKTDIKYLKNNNVQQKIDIKDLQEYKKAEINKWAVYKSVAYTSIKILTWVIGLSCSAGGLLFIGKFLRLF